MKNKLVLVLICLVFQVQAQQTEELKSEDVVQFWVNTYLEANEGEADYLDYAASLKQQLEHPIDINRVTLLELQQFVLLKPSEAAAIVAHREKFGDFIDLSELQAVAALDQARLPYLLPFFKLGQSNLGSSNFSQQLKAGKHRIRFSYQPGDRNKLLVNGRYPYLGDPSRDLLAYRFVSGNNIDAGYTGKKDAGEPFASNGITVYDFNSAYIQLTGKRKVSNLILGDYQASFGQALALANGFAMRKTSSVLQVMRNQNGFRPYRSLNENNYFRGAALSLRLSRSLTLQAMGSYKRLDARLTLDTTLSGQSSFGSFSLAGLHRTPSEMAMRKQVGEAIGALNLLKTWSHGEVGLLYNYLYLDKPLLKDPMPYQLFDFQGNTEQHVSVHGKVSYDNMLGFWEISSAGDGGMAFTTGMLVPLHQQLDMVMAYRNYSPVYHTLYAKPFAGGSLKNNENGMYTGLVLTLKKGLSLHQYIDLFTNPWLTYRLNATQLASDLFTELRFEPSRGATCLIRYRRQQAMEQDASLLASVVKSSVRIQMNYPINERCSGSNRIESTTHLNSHGFLFFQDLVWKLTSSRFDISSRLYTYYIPDYSVRTLMMGDEMPGFYGLSTLTGNGTGLYVLFRVKLKGHAVLGSKVTYLSELPMGSAPNSLPQRSFDVRTQLSMTF